MPDKPVTHGYDHRPFSFDPTLPGYWVYVHSSTVGVPSAWNGSTHYNPGDKVADSLFIYECMLANTNVQPAVNAQWYRYWIYSQPIFQNSWANGGGSLQNLRFRMSIGMPNVLDKDNAALVTNQDHQVEIQGSISGGNWSTIVFYLPPAYWPENEVRLPASDDVGGFVPIQVEPNGAVYKGLH